MLHAVLNQRSSSNKHFSIPAGCSENGLMIVSVHPSQHYNDATGGIKWETECNINSKRFHLLTAIRLKSFGSSENNFVH